MNIPNINTSFTSSWTSRTANLPKASAEVRAISLHKWYLSEKLGRDVGMSVAALDYNLNIKKAVPPAPKTHWFFLLLERLAATHGIRALADANYTARGGAAHFMHPAASTANSRARRAA